MRLRTRLRRTERLAERAKIEAVLHWGSVRRGALGLAALLAVVCSFWMLASAWSAWGPGLRPGVVVVGVGLDVVLVAAFALLALQNPRIVRSRRAWLVAMLLIAPVSLFAYWWLHVWRAPRLGPRLRAVGTSSG